MCRSSQPEDDGVESVQVVAVRFFRKKFRDCARIASNECCCDWKQKNNACNWILRMNTFNLRYGPAKREIFLLLPVRCDATQTPRRQQLAIPVSSWCYTQELILIRHVGLRRDLTKCNSKRHTGNKPRAICLTSEEKISI